VEFLTVCHRREKTENLEKMRVTSIKSEVFCCSACWQSSSSAACAQTLFALRTLRHHGLPDDAIHIVFQAVAVAKLSYATPAWWGFSSAADRSRIEGFLRRSVALNYRTVSAPSFRSICDSAGDKLFQCILHNSQHILFPLLPPVRDTQYSLRVRSHNHKLPARSSALTDNYYYYYHFIRTTVHNIETK
jgi:hypothetical protein